MKIAVEANKEEVAVKDEDVDEVGGPTMTTTTKEEKAHPEVVGEEPQNQGITSHRSNATTVRSLGIMLPNVELRATTELKRRSTTLKKELKKMRHYCWLTRTMKGVEIHNGISTMARATTCAGEKACS